jgi:hypothetical protein
MTVTLEAGNRLQLPSEWAEDLGLRGLVILNKTADGILIRPVPVASWDEVFAVKLPVGNQGSVSEDVEVAPDDLLF